MGKSRCLNSTPVTWVGVCHYRIFLAFASHRQTYIGSPDPDVRIESAAFQDDKPCMDVISAQSGMTELAAMLTERGLEAHKDKTCYIVCGSKEYQTKTNKEPMLMPLMFGEFPAKRKESDKYLGQTIHEDGL